jgi:DNA-binding MarR family transcriptional regulator
VKPYGANQIEDVVHARGRLNILVYLSSVDQADFMTLRDEIDLMSGSVAQHIKKLDEAGYVLVKKELLPGNSRTTVSITPAGRKALQNYVSTLTGLLSKGRDLMDRKVVE